MGRRALGLRELCRALVQTTERVLRGSSAAEAPDSGGHSTTLSLTGRHGEERNGKHVRPQREGGKECNEEGRRKGCSEGEKVSGGIGDTSW